MDSALREKYGERLDILDALSRNIEADTIQILRGTPHIDRICFRVKSVESFIIKANDPENNPQYLDPLVEIEDQVAGRIIVFFISDIDSVIQRIQSNYHQVESKRRKPLKDEEFGYESHHTVCMIAPQLKPSGWEAFEDLPYTFELQVRTIFMHAYAEPQHDIGYKSSKELPSIIKRELAWVAASAWGADFY